MKCLILAAGYATRLYPLTENFPKPLLTVGEKTILDWLVDDIDTSGEVDEYIVVSNHKYVYNFEDWAKTKIQKITVIDDGTSTNENRLGAVKDIQFVLETLQPDDDFLVIAGDNLLDFSLTSLISYALEKKTSCIMRYYEPDTEKLRKGAVAVLGEQENVLQITEKAPSPASHWYCPPFYYFTAADIRLVPEGIRNGCGTDSPGSFLVWLCEQTTIHAMKMPGRRYDIGNHESYAKVQKEYKGIIK